MQSHIITVALLVLLAVQPSRCLAAAYGGGSRPPSRRRQHKKEPAESASPLAVANAITALASPAPLAVTYATKASCVEDWFFRFAQDETALGFDTETRPTFRKGDVYPPATLQLSTATDCLVVHLQHLDSMPQILGDTLASDVILKVGVGIDEDAVELWLHHGLDVNARLDPASVHKGDTKSLRGLAEELLGVRLDKSNSLTLTDWSKRQLNVAELQYAALDAWAGRALHDALARRRQEAERSDEAEGSDAAAASGTAPAPAVSRLAELVGDNERSCAALYAYRRVRQALRRQFIALDEEV